MIPILSPPEEFPRVILILYLLGLSAAKSTSLHSALDNVPSGPGTEGLPLGSFGQIAAVRSQ